MRLRLAKFRKQIKAVQEEYLANQYSGNKFEMAGPQIDPLFDLEKLVQKNVRERNKKNYIDNIYNK